MKIATNPSSIIAAADACLAWIKAQRDYQDAAALAPYATGTTGFWFWRKTFTRTHEQKVEALNDAYRPRMLGGMAYPGRPTYYPSNFAWDVSQRCYNLLAIAKHKRGSGLIEIEDPYLSDIAQFLEPWENPRI